MFNNLLKNYQWALLSYAFDASKKVTNTEVVRLLKYSIISFSTDQFCTVSLLKAKLSK